MIKHVIRLIKSSIRERIVKKVRRSSKWPSIRNQFLRNNPTCAACGGTSHIQVHHKEPFHTDPEMELNPNNLISLCMGKKDCHLLLGHGGSFKFFSPTIETDAAIVLRDPSKFKEVVELAEKNRLPNSPESNF